MSTQTITLYVTYSARGGMPTTSVGYQGDPSNPLTFPVQVVVRPGMDRLAVYMQAVAHAQGKYEEYLRRRFASPPQLPPAPSVQAGKLPPTFIEEEKEDLLLFDPDEIIPVVELALERVVAVTSTAVRFVLTGHGTASTDCLSIVNINPEPALRGNFGAFFGRALHESSHIRWDQGGTKLDRERRFGDEAFGTVLLGRAREEGGETLQNILNLIMDRRVDWLHATEFPGNATDIWYRLGDLLPGEREVEVWNEDLQAHEFKWVSRSSGVTRECLKSVFTDFVYACKKHTKGNHPCVRTAITMVNKAIARVNAGTRKYSHLLTVSRCVLKLLRENQTQTDEENEEQSRQTEDEFNELMRWLVKQIYGHKIDPRAYKAFRQLMAGRMAAKRGQALRQLPTLLKLASRGTAGLGKAPPAMIGYGSGSGEKLVVDVPPDEAAYQQILPLAQPFVGPLREVIRRLSIPQRREITGLIEGDFDLEALPVLVTGGRNCMKIELTRRKLDLALSFMVDVSGSMDGSPVKQAKTLGVCFNEALIGFERSVDGYFFAFDDKVYRCGGVQPNNGIASVRGGGGTNEAFALYHAAVPLSKSRRRRKIVIVACDGMPANPEAVKQQCERLLKAGILPIRALIGVDQAPGTYPIELYFDSWDDYLREMKKTFGSIFAAARQ